MTYTDHGLTLLLYDLFFYIVYFHFVYTHASSHFVNVVEKGCYITDVMFF